MKKYKRIVIEANGSTDVLKTVEEIISEPKPGEVRVRVLAAGVGFADGMAQHGGYPLAPKLPFTPGYDFAGIVDQLGEGVTGIMEGQYVAGLNPESAVMPSISAYLPNSWYQSPQSWIRPRS